VSASSPRLPARVVVISTVFRVTTSALLHPHHICLEFFFICSGVARGTFFRSLRLSFSYPKNGFVTPLSLSPHDVYFGVPFLSAVHLGVRSTGILSRSAVQFGKEDPPTLTLHLLSFWHMNRGPAGIVGRLRGSGESRILMRDLVFEKNASC